MTPLKDTLEVANAAAENSGAAASDRPKTDSGGLRSDAVSLEVPVNVHGSRVIEVLRGITASQTVPEQYVLDLEREAFVSLCGERKTQERIAHTLKTGKPLRN